jgi:TonB family protein
MAALFLAATLAISPARSNGQESNEGSRKVLSRVSPQCSEIARRMRITGVVKAEVLVSPNGTVKSVQIKGGHPVLAQAAQAALLKWKWEPTAHETQESIEIKFTKPD